VRQFSYKSNQAIFATRGHTETTKIEAFNDFLDWICFGGPVVKSGDPVEQEKKLKYASFIANTIILSNVADMTGVLASWLRTGTPSPPGWSPVSVPIPASISADSVNTYWIWTSRRNRLEPQLLPFDAAL
jgi:hypothetical protein